MRVRSVLTRGEVVEILKVHLRKQGRIPNDAKLKYQMAILEIPGGFEPAGKSWGDPPGMYFEWDEETIVEDETPFNDEGM